MYIQLNIRKANVAGYSEFHATHATIFSLLIITIYRNGKTKSKAITYYMTLKLKQQTTGKSEDNRGLITSLVKNVTFA